MCQVTDPTIQQILAERFGQDSLIALATVQGGQPSVRTVDAFYEAGAFYVLTHEHSNKMQQIVINPIVGLCGDWFTGHGVAHNMGWFNRPENVDIAAKMRTVFAQWIDNGHNDFSDIHTIILRIDLTDCVVFSGGKRYTFGG